MPASGDLFAGVDIGTSSVRLAILDEGGRIHASHTCAIKTWRDKNDPAIYEQSTANIWQAIQSAFQAIHGTAELEHVKSIGLDSTCSLAVTDKQGRPMSVSKETLGQSDDERNVVLWMDHRAEAEAAAINATRHAELEALGGYMHMELDMPKILWLKKRLGARFHEAVFFSLADYFTFRLSGLLAKFSEADCEPNFARYIAPSIAYQPKGGFSPSFLNTVDLGDLHLDRSLTLQAGLPLPSSSLSALQDLGLQSDTIVASSVVDCYAGFVGTIGYPTAQGGTFEDCKSRLAAVAGTSTCIILESPISAKIDGVWGPFEDCIIAGWSMIMGGQSATGDLLSYILDTHPAKSQLPATPSVFEAVQQVLDDFVSRRKARSAVDLAKDAFLYPDFRGNRCPLNDGDMKGLIYGLTMDDSLLDLVIKYQIAMEGIATQMRHIVDSFRNAGHAIEEICISGSQALNTPLIQLVSDVCELPVVAPTHPALSVVAGSAQLARYAFEVRKAEGAVEPTMSKVIALRHRETLWTCMQAMTPAGRRIEPSASATDKAILKAKMEMFHDSIAMQRRWRASIKGANERPNDLD